jgi:hypothetical protein
VKRQTESTEGVRADAPNKNIHWTTEKKIIGK